MIGSRPRSSDIHPQTLRRQVSAHRKEADASQGSRGREECERFPGVASIEGASDGRGLPTCPWDVITFEGGFVRIKLADRTLFEGLRKFLSFDSNAIVTKLSDDEVEVSFLGSLNSVAQQIETELRLRMWMAQHADAIVVLRE